MSTIDKTLSDSYDPPCFGVHSSPLRLAVGFVLLDLVSNIQWGLLLPTTGALMGVLMQMTGERSRTMLLTLLGPAIVIALAFMWFSNS